MQIRMYATSTGRAFLVCERCNLVFLQDPGLDDRPDPVSFVPLFIRIAAHMVKHAVRVWPGYGW